MTFARYLGYRLKNTALRSIVFALLSVALVLNVVDGCNGNVDYPEWNESGIYMLAIVMGIFATIIPMLETACFKNRRNLDTLYFFPIKREKLALVHYLSGLIQVLFIYSASFFATYAYLAVNTDIYDLRWMMLYYLFSILLGFVLYSVFIFLFAEANTVVDGVIFSLLWIFVIYLIAWQVRAELLKPALYDSGHWASSSGLPSWGIIYAPINNLTEIFQDLIEVNKNIVTEGGYSYGQTRAIRAAEFLKHRYFFYIWFVLGLGAAFGYFCNFMKKGAEKAGEISSSWFGYKTLIPAYAYSLLLFYDSIDIMTILIFSAMLIGYIIYRRGFKFKLSDYIMLGIGVIVFIIGI